MAIQTSAGSTFAIATGLPGTYDATGFNALTWNVVGEVTDIGEFGKEFNLVSHSPIGTRAIKKLKGSINYGNLSVQMAKDNQVSANQDKLKTALASDSSYSFRIVLQDATKLYFTGKVMTFKNAVGGVDSMTGASTSIEMDGDVVEV